MMDLERSKVEITTDTNGARTEPHHAGRVDDGHQAAVAKEETCYQAKGYTKTPTCNNDRGAADEGGSWRSHPAGGQVAVALVDEEADTDDGHQVAGAKVKTCYQTGVSTLTPTWGREADIESGAMRSHTAVAIVAKTHIEMNQSHIKHAQSYFRQ